MGVSMTKKFGGSGQQNFFVMRGKVNVGVAAKMFLYWT